MMTENKLTLIVDWMDTLYHLMKKVDRIFLKKLIDLKQNGVDIIICSSQELNVIQARLGDSGLGIDEASYIPDLGKDTVGFWQKVIRDRNLDPARVIVLDDFSKNCAAVNKAGLTSIPWEYGDELCLEELDTVLKMKGYTL